MLQLLLLFEPTAFHHNTKYPHKVFDGQCFLKADEMCKLSHASSRRYSDPRVSVGIACRFFLFGDSLAEILLRADTCSNSRHCHQGKRQVTAALLLLRPEARGDMWEHFGSNIDAWCDVRGKTRTPLISVLSSVI